MIILIYLGIMFLVHWYADFVLQTHEEATKKSSSNRALLSHTSTYAFVWTGIMWLINFVCTGVLGLHILALAFGLITFICHTIQDYFTSRWVKKYFSKQDFHNGFVVIGADQVFHYVQLILTFVMLYL